MNQVTALNTYQSTAKFLNATLLGTLLAGHLVSLLWSSKQVGYNERRYLLERLVQYIEGSLVKKLYGHFDAGELANFIGNIEEKGYRKYVSKDDYIRSAAQNDGLGLNGGDPFSDDVATICENDRILSMSGLFTLWDDEKFPLEVYRRKSDNKIVLRYPNPKGVEYDEWEGHFPGDKYKLHMKAGREGELFDGQNGKLIDNDGNEVKVYRDSRKRRR